MPDRDRNEGPDAARHAAGADGAPPVRRARRSAGWRRALWIGALLVLAAAAVAGAPRLLYLLHHESTDDAYVDATVIPISPQVAGRVSEVFVGRDQQVGKGDPLLQIDPEEYRDRVAQAAARREARESDVRQLEAELREDRRALAQAEAERNAAAASLDLAAKERERQHSLLRGGVVSQEDADRAEAAWKIAREDLRAREAGVAHAKAAIGSTRAKLETARTGVKEARAALDLARLDLSRTRVVAPIAGRVTMRNVDPGKFVQPGETLLALVDLEHVWIRANYKETQIEKMRAGQPVDIDVDAYPGHAFRGHVESFQAGSGSVFSLLPPENATGEFVKVVQRIPVRIGIDSPADPDRPLYPGMSVTPHVDIRARGKADANRPASREGPAAP